MELKKSVSGFFSSAKKIDKHFSKLKDIYIAPAQLTFFPIRIHSAKKHCSSSAIELSFDVCRVPAESRDARAEDT